MLVSESHEITTPEEQEQGSLTGLGIGFWVFIPNDVD